MLKKYIVRLTDAERETLDEVVGKFKGSQNRSAADRAGVDAALRAAGRSSAEVTELLPELKS